MSEISITYGFEIARVEIAIIGLESQNYDNRNFGDYISDCYLKKMLTRYRSFLQLFDKSDIMPERHKFQ